MGEDKDDRKGLSWIYYQLLFSFKLKPTTELSAFLKNMHHVFVWHLASSKCFQC